MKHRFVAVLLERKREELGEPMSTFGKRLYPDSDSETAGNNYFPIAHMQFDIPDCRLPFAAEILGIPLELLRTI